MSRFLKPEPKTDSFDLRVELFDWAQALMSAVIFVILLFALIACMFNVEGSSMVPTLHDGEKLIISNLFYTPAQGDIIMFTKKGVHVLDTEPGRDAPLVKRVIATEGQSIYISEAEQRVYVDGVPLEEPYIAAPPSSRGNWLPDAPVTVPEGCVFVMGDNRNASSDSRYQTIGMVDTRYILGRVLLRVTPINKLGTVR